VEPPSPEALVRWCQRTLPNDTRAFEQLVARYKGRVFATALRMMGDAQEAEDQAQEVFIKVYRGIATLDEPATLGSWITRITVNTCLDALAKQRRRPRTVPIEPAEDQGSAPPQFEDTRTPSPETSALRDEERRCIESALARLEPASRAALMLRDIDDRPYQEVASLLALGLSAAKMRIHRARIAFQRMLEGVCPELARSNVAP
jgi:RNA polymerase sigma-70 factor (ECF subfamily)